MIDDSGKTNLDGPQPKPVDLLIMVGSFFCFGRFSTWPLGNEPTRLERSTFASANTIAQRLRIARPSLHAKRSCS